jgi:hypothetical protein
VVDASHDKIVTTRRVRLLDRDRADKQASHDSKPGTEHRAPAEGGCGICESHLDAARGRLKLGPSTRLTSDNHKLVTPHRQTVVLIGDAKIISRLPMRITTRRCPQNRRLSSSFAFFWTAVTCHRFALQCEALFQHHRNLHWIANNWLQVEKYQSGDESSHSKKCKTRT